MYLKKLLTLSRFVSKSYLLQFVSRLTALQMHGRVLLSRELQIKSQVLLIFFQLDSEVFTLKIANAEKFEEKIRGIERELGITPEDGIAISYQREKYVHVTFSTYERNMSIII